jgi:hypothetical protein
MVIMLSIKWLLGNETAVNIDHFCTIKFIYDCLEATFVTGTEKFQKKVFFYVQA